MNALTGKSVSGLGDDAEEHFQKFAEHARRRRQNSESIYVNATEFKVCSVCLSTSYQRARLCPFCRSYRWFYSPEVVKMIALVTEGSVVPFTAGVAPRFLPEQLQQGEEPRKSTLENTN
jgi:hypothetical protein